MINVVFVCLGNICRSPAAEGIFRKLIIENNLENNFYIDSAGTSAYHVGETADKRMRDQASKSGYTLTSLSRKLLQSDLKKFDYVIAMDNSNLVDILYLDINKEYKNKIKLMTDFSTKYLHKDVPDPYYGGLNGFKNVINILEDSCKGFLQYLKSNGKI